MKSREDMIKFILSQFDENREELESLSDEALKRLHDEAYRYSEWGL